MVMPYQALCASDGQYQRNASAHWAWRGDRVSKTLPEPDACVSAEGEAGKGEHGVRDPVFAFRSPRQAPDRISRNHTYRLEKIWTSYSEK